MDYKIFTDICCDLPLSYIQEHDLTVFPFPVMMEGREYAITSDPTDPNAVDVPEFYNKLRAGTPAKTSQLSMDLCRKEFEKVLKEGKDIIHIAFTSALSGSFNTSHMIAEELMQQYPDRKVIVIDSLCASLGQGMLVYLAVEQAENGMDIDSLAKYVEQMRDKVHHWVVVDDLVHLKRGGRVSGPVAVIGTLLGIKPILIVNEKGELPAIDKIQGRKRALRHLIDKMDKLVKRPIEAPVFISHGDCEQDALAVAEMVKQRLGVEVMMINHISPIIGCHAGPGTVALFFVSDKPKVA